MKKNIGIIIQARCSSSRLPNKIFLPLPYLSKKTVLSNVVERCKIAVDNIIIATTENNADDKVVEFAKVTNVNFFRGSENDVLKRYLDCAKKYQLDIIVRVTSDCPCIDPDIITVAIDKLLSTNVDYVSNVIERTFPHGLDIEVFTIDALIKADKLSTDIRMREHVTQPIIQSDSFTKYDIVMSNNQNYSDIRITIDNEEDYTALLTIFDMLKENFRTEDIIRLYSCKPYIKFINKNIYHKKPFTTIKAEFEEAKVLLKLYGMVNVVKILDKNVN